VEASTDVDMKAVDDSSNTLVVEAEVKKDPDLLTVEGKSIVGTGIARAVY